MNQNNNKISFIYSIITFLLLLIGILYVYLAEVSMGFARDLIYREYFIRDTILSHINLYFLSYIWLIPFFYSFNNSLKNKYSSSFIVNIVTYLFLTIFSLLFLDEYVGLWAVFSIFGILRLPFLFQKSCVNV